MDFNKDIIFSALEDGDNDLLAIAKDQKKIEQIKTHPFFKPYLDELQTKADAWIGTPLLALPFSMFKLVDVTGNREIYQEQYFIHRYRLITFAILAWLYEKPEYYSEVEDALWAICDEYTWALPAHISGATKIRDDYPIVDAEGYVHDVPRADERTLDLFATETSYAIAEITELLSGKLHPKVVHRARKCAYERVIAPFMTNVFFWEDAPMNWCSVCAGNIGATALYLVKDEPTLTLIVRRVLFNFSQYLSKGFLPDGTTTEGLSYWNYGFSRFTCFADLLNTRSRGKLDLLTMPDITPILSFPEISLLHNRIVAAFADNAAVINGRTFGVMSYLNRYFDGLPATVWATDDKNIIDGNGSFAVTLRNLLWTDPDDTCESLPEKTYVLPMGNWVTTRGADTVSFAAKGGSNDESHNHNDVGGFIYQAGSNVFFSDFGQGEYTTQYFDKHKRYEHLVTSSRGHSLPIIDGKYQIAGKGTNAENFAASEVDNVVNVTMDIKNAYGYTPLQSLTRNLKFEKANGTLNISDTYKFADDGEHTVTERLVSLLDATVIPEKNVVRLIGKDRTVDISYDPNTVTPAISHEEYSNHQCVMTQTTEIDFTAKVVGSATLSLTVTQKNN